MFSVKQNSRISPHRFPGKRHGKFPAFAIGFSPVDYLNGGGSLLLGTVIPPPPHRALPCVADGFVPSEGLEDLPLLPVVAHHEFPDLLMQVLHGILLRKGFCAELPEQAVLELLADVHSPRKAKLVYHFFRQCHHSSFRADAFGGAP